MECDTFVVIQSVKVARKSCAAIKVGGIVETSRLDVQDLRLAKHRSIPRSKRDENDEHVRGRIEGGVL